MKKILINFTFIVFATTLVACKAIEMKLANGLYHMFLPAFTPDLMKLNASLIYYKKTYSNWPNTLDNLREEFIIDSIRFKLDNFERLSWTISGDSIAVDFALKYSETDTMKIKFLNGRYTLIAEADTSFHQIFQSMNGESKDGQLRWEIPEDRKMKGKSSEKVELNDVVEFKSH